MRILISRFGLFGYLLTFLIFSLDQTSSMALKRVDPDQTDSQSVRPNKPTQTKTEPNKAVLPTISPYEIASFITANPVADLKNIWNQLGIGNPHFGYRSNSEEQQGEPGANFLSKCNYCEVDTYSCDLDGESGKEVLVKVSDRLSESCRYLVFKRTQNRGSKTDWKLLGYIDHGFGRYRMPEHSILPCDGRDWLVVKVQEGSGSGFSEYYDRLVYVDSTGLKEILRFPSEGHLSTCCDYPTREFTARIIKCEIKNNVTSVELEFAVSYSAYLGNDDEGHLWKKKQKAVYNSDPSSHRLVLDITKSDLSLEEIEAIYGEGLTDENFIKYNNHELSKIASSREDNRRKWLGRFLSQCEVSPEVERLRQLMNQ